MVPDWLADAIGGCLTFVFMLFIFFLFALGVFFMFGGFGDSKGSGRCVQEDSYMGENVVTCEPVE